MISPSSSPTASHRASWSEPVLPLPPAVDHSSGQDTDTFTDTSGSRTPIADLFRVDISGKPPKGLVVASSGSSNSALSSSTNRSGFSSSRVKSVDAPIISPILDKKKSEVAIRRGGARDAQSPNESSGVDASAFPVSGAPRLSVQQGSKNSSNEDWATSVLIAARVEPRFGV